MGVFIELELELELIQAQMTQSPVLRGELDARAWRVCGQTRGGSFGESACVVKPIEAWLCLRGQLSLLWCSPAGVVQVTAELQFGNSS